MYWADAHIACLPLITCPSAMEASEVPQSSSPEMVEMAEENGSVAEPTEIPSGPEHSSFSVPSAEENEEKDLPADFERLWLAAHENPPDFTSWTDLLQYCEQEVGDQRERETSSRKIHKQHCFLLLLQTFMLIHDGYIAGLKGCCQITYIVVRSGSGHSISKSTGGLSFPLFTLLWLLEKIY